jgi:uncharacterized membrane protein
MATLPRRPMTVYEAVLLRFENLRSHRDKIVRIRVSEAINLANYLLQHHYCQTHFVSTLLSVLREEGLKHAPSSVSREAFDVCIVAIQLAVDDVAIKTFTSE